jgi:hypothetical protein
MRLHIYAVNLWGRSDGRCLLSLLKADDLESSVAIIKFSYDHIFKLRLIVFLRYGFDLNSVVDLASET